MPIDVTCAIIIHENKILAAQRSEHMRLPLKWEFPGGKVEENEVLDACLIREIKEELNLIVTIKAQLKPSVFEYPNGIVIQLFPFVCIINSGNLHLKEHKQIAWLAKDELLSLDWAEADIPIVHDFIENY